MFRRAPITIVEDLAEVEARAETTEGPLVVIFDADNTVVRQGAPPEEFAEEVNRTIDRFEALPAVERVIVLSNGPARGVERMINRGNKPWTTRRRLSLVESEADVWVVGDQILTDGMLAWHLGADFFHQAIARTGEQPRQTIMRALGRMVGRLFLRGTDSS
jgi:predicted HAD superfamily phosphohydrolase YqeG